MATKRVPVVEFVPSIPESATEEQAREDDRPAIGSWWWVTDKGKNPPTEYDEPGKRWLACVIEVGSNYAKLEGVRFHLRLALDDFHQRCKPEKNVGAYIDTKVGFYKTRVRALVSEIQKLCHQLGVPMRDALVAAQEDAPTTALAVVHGTEDVKKYGKALVKAKDKTLPELFAKMEAEHKAMAMWMKAELIPAQAELEIAKGVTEVISEKIHTVELYAGLHEKLVQVKEGDPAALDAKVHLMQRRHYMDEECLARYEAGGMSFKDIKAFDKWISRDEHMTRILPHERCIIAFRIRRYGRQTDDKSIEAFIELWHENRENMRTYLYIRNGRQLWRMETSISFDEELFPSREDSDLLGDDELWVKPDADPRWERMLITGKRRASMIESWKQTRRARAHQLLEWKRQGKPTEPWRYFPIEGDDHYREPIGGVPQSTLEIHERGWDPSGIRNPPHLDFELLTPENIYYDDAVKRIRHAAMEHNRVAVIVQGLLDRSTCLHPHPPWKIFTAEGFAAGIELTYDVSRVITPGEEPDFEEYRKQLNRSLRAGCHTIGQYRAWKAETDRKYGHLKRWEIRERVGEGPDIIAEVVKVRADGACLFEWTRARLRGIWVDHPTKRGYRQKQWPEIPMSWWCPASELTCVDAYTPGDYRMFFDDPRTRANYIRWAPILLSAENWHARRRISKDQARKKKRKSEPTYDDEIGDDE